MSLLKCLSHALTKTTHRHAHTHIHRHTHTQRDWVKHVILTIQTVWVSRGMDNFLAWDVWGQRVTGEYPSHTPAIMASISLNHPLTLASKTHTLHPSYLRPAPLKLHRHHPVLHFNVWSNILFKWAVTYTCKGLRIMLWSVWVGSCEFWGGFLRDWGEMERSSPDA